MYLYRSLLESPQLGHHIKQLCLYFILRGKLDLTPLYPCRDISGIDDKWTRFQIPSHFPWGILRPEGEAWLLVARQLLHLALNFRVLALTPELRALEFGLPDRFMGYGYNHHDLLDFIDQSLSLLWDGGCPLPKLESLCMRARIVYRGPTRVSRPSDLMVRAYKYFLSLPRLWNVMWAWHGMDKYGHLPIYLRGKLPTE